MATKKEENSSGSDSSEKMVTVLKPIAADGIYDGGGWEAVSLPESVALAQLALPREARNAHWKHAKLAE